jgi:membrane protein YqaA with SNARE-associated domain
MTRPPSRDQETHDMTTIAQRRSTAAAPFVGLALAASLLGGIAGGAVALAIPAVIQAHAAQAAERAKWLQYGQDWERRYREMYPIVDAG